MTMILDYSLTKLSINNNMYKEYILCK